MLFTFVFQFIFIGCWVEIVRVLTTEGVSAAFRNTSKLNRTHSGVFLAFDEYEQILNEFYKLHGE